MTMRTERTTVEILGQRGRELVQELRRRVAKVREELWEDVERAWTPEERGLLMVAADKVRGWAERMDDEAMAWYLDVAWLRAEADDPAQVRWEVFAKQIVFELEAEIEALRRVREALAAPATAEEAVTENA